MKRAAALTLLAFGVVLFATADARGDTIYTQPLRASFSGASSNEGGQNVADGFSLATAASVTGIEWYGYYGTNPPSSITAPEFELAIYSDASGVPGTSLSAQTVNASFTVAGTSLIGTNIYHYTASVSNVDLAAGTDYWMSIVESETRTPKLGGGQWLWSRATTSGMHATRGAGSWTASSGAGFAYTLTGSVSAVPLPDAAWAGLSVLGLMVIVTMVQRRRRHRGSCV